MPDEEHRVVYRAVADFAELIAQAAAARAEMQALTRDVNTMGQRQGGAAQTQRSLTTAVASHTQSLAALNRAERAQEVHEEKLGALRAKNNELLRQSQAMFGLKGDEQAYKNLYNDLVREATAIDAVAISHDKAAVSATNRAEKELTAEQRLEQQLHRTAAALAGRTGASTRAAEVELTAEQRLEQQVHRTAAVAASAVTARTRAAEVELTAEQRLEQQVHRTATTKTRALIADEQLAQATTRSAVQEANAVRTGEKHAATLAILAARLASTGKASRKSGDDFTGFMKAVGASLLGGVHAMRDVEAGGTRVSRALSGVGQAWRSASGGGGGTFVRGFFAGFADFADAAGDKLVKFGKHLLSWRGLMVAALAAAGPLVGILGALGGGALGLANNFVSLAGSAAALPGLFAAAGAALGALLLAGAPVVSLLKALSAQNQLLTAGSGQMAEMQRAAARKVTDAQHGYLSASRAVIDAQFREREAQLDLNDARLAATRDLEDLRTELNRASLNEQGAILALQQAQLDYRKSLADPTGSLLDREQALLRVKQAQMDLQDVQVKNKRTQQDYNTAAQRGVDGSRQVVSAQKAVQDAAFATAQAQYQLTTSVQDLTIALKEQAAGGSELYKANLAVQAALENMGPSARAFGEFLKTNYHLLHDTQVMVGEGIFTPLLPELSTLKGLMPTVQAAFTGAATAIGAVLAAGVRMVERWRASGDLNTLIRANSTIITNLGNAMLSIADGLEKIAIAAAPFTQWLTGAIAKIADGFDRWATTAAANGSIARFLRDTQGRLHTMYDVVRNLLTLFGGLLGASNDFARGQLQSLDDITKRWADWATQQDQTKSGLRTWLRDIQPVLHAVAQFVGAIARGFADLAKDPRNLDEATRLLQALADRVLPAIVDLFDQLASSHLLSNFASGPLATALHILTDALKLLAPVLSAPGVSDGLKTVASGLALVAAIGVVGKFTGLFHIIRTLAQFKRDMSGNWLTGLISGLDKATGLNARAAASPQAALGRSAVALNESAVALNEAAIALNEAAVALAEGGLAGRSGLMPTRLGRVGRAGTTAGEAAGGAAAGEGATGGGLTGLAANPVTWIVAAVLAAIAALGLGVASGLGGKRKAGDVFSPIKDFAAHPSVSGLAKAGLEMNPIGLTAFEVTRFVEGVWKPTFKRSVTWLGDYLRTEFPGVFAALPKAFAVAMNALKDSPVLGPTVRAIEHATDLINKAWDKATGKVPVLGRALDTTLTRVDGLFAKMGQDYQANLGPLFSDFLDNTKTASEHAQAFSDALDRIATDGAIPATTQLKQYSIVADMVNGANLTAEQRAGAFSSILSDIASNAASDAQKMGAYIDVFGQIANSALGASTKFDLLKQAYQGLIQPAQDVADVQDTYQEQLNSLGDAQLKDTEKTNKKSTAYIELKKQLAGALQASEDIYLQDIANGRDATAAQSDLEKRNQALGDTATKAGLAKDDVKRLNTEYTQIPPKVATTITADTGQAVSAIQSIYSNLIMTYIAQKAIDEHITLDQAINKYGDSIKGVAIVGDQYAANRQSTYNQQVPKAARASGGLVPGPNDQRADTSTIWASAGEWLTRKRVVDKPYAKQVLSDLNEERIDPATIYAALNLTARASAVPSASMVKAAAARLVSSTTTVNNTTSRGLSMGGITINNPVREPSERSLRRTLQTLTYLHAR